MATIITRTYGVNLRGQTGREYSEGWIEPDTSVTVEGPAAPRILADGSELRMITIQVDGYRVPARAIGFDVVETGILRAG